jgi:hypothetical protein
MSTAVAEIGRGCAGVNCAARVTLKYGRYCDPCRSRARRKKRIYVSNDLIDAQIRRTYIEKKDKRKSDIPTTRQLGKRFNWPVYAVRVRARELGLARTKDKQWSDAEIAILERFAWMSPARIQIKLKAKGFHRTQTAIDVKLDRTYARRNTPFFTGRGLASLLGIDSHAVTRWINLGYLKAKRRGTERHDGNGGDMYMIHENDVRVFVYARPMEIDLRKVDQLWFLDFITEGKIAGA